MRDLLTVAEAAARLGLSRQRVHALIQAGRLPARRFGHAWAIAEADLALVTRRPTGYPKGRPRK